MPSFTDISNLFNDVWNDLKQGGTANLHTFVYFLILLVFFVIVLAYSYSPII